MRKQCKWMALGLAVVMLVSSLLTGCGSKSAESGTSSTKSTAEEGTKTETAQGEAGVDISERVDLVCYFVGDEPKDMSIVEEKINEILLEKINATITFNFTTWTDYYNKYNMILTGGEDCDIIYSDTWVNLIKLVDDQAFLELNDYIDQYAPELRQVIPAEKFENATVNGGLYSVPNATDSWVGDGIVYREDLRKKYDLPVPDSLENVEAYMQGIKENMPEQTITVPTTDILWMKYGWTYFPSFGLQSFFDNPSVLTEYWNSEDHLEDLKMFKRWADAGYWSRSALAELSNSTEPMFEAGAIVMVAGGMNPTKYVNFKDKFSREHPDWEVGFVPYADTNGVAYPSAAWQDGTSIPVHSKNPERAIMAIAQMLTNEELNHLILYGIEGEHYEVDENGYYVAGEKYENFTYEASDAWNFKNEEFRLTKESDKEKYEVYDHIATIAENAKYPGANIAGTFPYVVSNTNAEAALTAVKTEYLTPLECGMVDDVEAGLKKFMEEAEKVGLRDLQEEYTQLWTKYCDEKGFK